MAWSFVAHRGSANNKTSGTVLAVAPSAQLPVGAVVIAVCVSDNIQNASSTEDHCVFDFKGNVWLKVGERTNAAAAAAGITLSVWHCRIAVAVETTDNIILGIRAAAAAKAIGLYQYSIGAGNGYYIAGLASSEQDATQAPTVTLNNLQAGSHAFFGVVARENDDVNTHTMDSDYNERTKFGTTGGTGNTNVSAIVGDRLASIVTDTFAPTGLSASSDVVTALVALREVVPYRLTVTDVQQAGGKTYVRFGKRELEFETLEHAQKFATFSQQEGEAILQRLAISRYLQIDPAGSNPNVIEGRSITYTNELNRMIEVF